MAQYQQAAPGETDKEMKTLWIGDLAYWMDETFLYGIFAGTGQLVTVKIIRNKNTNLSEGYGFVEFLTHEAAEGVLRAFNGTQIPNTEQTFRLNWAAFGVGKMTNEDHSIFVGDLAPDVTDYVLQDHFRNYYPSVRSAKVITDVVTGRSKGYGFVRFGSESERDRALVEMNGTTVGSRPIRVSIATAKKHNAGSGQGPGAAASAPHPSDYDPTNTTLFIGGLSAAVSEEELRATFAPYGDIVYTKIPPGKGCGFVQFVHRGSAELAMNTMQGQSIGGSAIRISWGRSSTASRANAAAVAAAAPLAYAGGAAGYGSAGAYSAGFDPALYGYAAPGALGSATAGVDPYAAYYSAALLQGQPADSHAYQMYQTGGASTAALAGSLATPTASAQIQAVPAKPELFDPLGPIDVEKLNAVYINRHQGTLLGSHLHAQ